VRLRNQADAKKLRQRLGVNLVGFDFCMADGFYKCSVRKAQVDVT